jgi:tRNA(fMet)-specific endonuclease VapC
MAIVVDTSYLIALERDWIVREPRSSPQFPTDGVVASVSMMELRMGMLLADSDARRNARSEFADHVRRNLLVIPFGTDEAEMAADLLVSLRRAGQTIGERDLMIAATAVANGHSLVTLNAAEFARVPGLTLLPNPLASP